MGNGQGSEKQDAIWHAAHNAATTEKFDAAMAANAGKMTAGNYAVPEPTTQYFTGNYAQRRPVFAQRDMGQLVDAPIDCLDRCGSQSPKRLQKGHLVKNLHALSIDHR